MQYYKLYSAISYNAMLYAKMLYNTYKLCSV